MFACTDSPSIDRQETHMSPEPTRFERTFIVADGDIDALGHVNNVVYLQWVQDVAVSHWQQAATPEQQRETVWVAIRHEIDYAAPAFARDEIVARTWVEEWTGATSEALAPPSLYPGPRPRW